MRLHKTALYFQAQVVFRFLTKSFCLSDRLQVKEEKRLIAAVGTLHVLTVTQWQNRRVICDGSEPVEGLNLLCEG